jgi:hypothetical protein
MLINPQRVAKTMSDETVDNSTSSVIAVKSSGVKKDRVVLFTIDDVEYDVPAKPGINITLKFLNTMRKSDNEMFAALQLLEDMLGAEKYADLLNFEELTDELLGKILEQCVALAMTRVEDQAGK